MTLIKNLYILCGRSGSGKDSVSDRLCKEHGLIKVNSYTTRPRRRGEQNTHIFVNQKGFDEIRHDLVAYTFFNSFEYGATNQQVNESDIYILDKNGIIFFQKKYDKHKPVKIIYIDVPESICRLRMLQRGDDKEKVNKRIENDRVEFDGIEDLADIVISNNYFNSCVCDIWEYILNCEKEES